MAIFLDNAAALEEDTWARKVGDEHEVGMSSFTFEEHDADTAHKVVSQQTLRKQKELAETALKSQVSIQCFGKLIYYIYIFSSVSSSLRYTKKGYTLLSLHRQHSAAHP